MRQPAADGELGSFLRSTSQAPLQYAFARYSAGRGVVGECVGDRVGDRVKAAGGHVGATVGIDELGKLFGAKVVTVEEI